MEVFVHKLFDSMITGHTSEMMNDHDMSNVDFPQSAQYPVVFSEENASVYYEHELIDIDRPLEKDIFLVGSVSSEERFASYAMPVIIDSLSGQEWDINTHEAAIEFTTVIRVSMITGNETPGEAYAQLRYMQIFAQQLLRNPPNDIQQWWGRSATLTGFTSVFGLPMERESGASEELIFGKWFGAVFREFMIPSEHVSIRRI